MRWKKLLMSLPRRRPRARSSHSTLKPIGRGSRTLFRVHREIGWQVLCCLVSGLAPTRQELVRRGLESLALQGPLPRAHQLQLLARPFASAELFERAIVAGRAHGAAVPGVAPTDTIKVVNDREEVVDTPDRARLRAVQTPQSFRFAALLEAHRRAAKEGIGGFPDDGALAEWGGLRVTVFEGEPANVKLTLETDFASAERCLGASGGNWIMRVGSGFDVHAFTDGDHVWLGGCGSRPRGACSRIPMATSCCTH